MKKSKFLKKSLAMLLALMLVVAMIPLSASAAELPALEYITVGTTQVKADGNSFSATYAEGSTGTPISVTAELPEKTKLEAIHKDGVNTTNIAATGSTLNFSDFAEENGVYTITLKLSSTVADDGRAPVEYTLTLSPKAPSKDAGVKSIALASDAKDHGLMAVSYDQTKRVVTVTAAYNYSSSGKITVTPVAGATVTGGTAGASAEIALSTETFTVTSEAGEAYDWNIKVEEVPALTSLSVAGKEGVFSDSTPGDGKNDTITVTLTLDDIKDQYGEVDPSPALVVDYKALANTEVKDGTAFASGAKLTFTDLGTNYTAAKTINVKNGTSSSDYAYTLNVVIPKSDDTSVLFASIGGVEATISGSSISAVLEEDTDLVTEPILVFHVAKGAAVKANGITFTPDKTNTAYDKYTSSAAVDLSSPKTIVVTAADGTASKQYSVSATNASEASEAVLISFSLKDPDGKTYSATVDQTTKAITTEKLPYMTTGINDWVMYATFSSGAKAVYNSNTVINGQTKFDSASGWTDGEDKVLTKKVKVVSLYDADVFNEYTIKVTFQTANTNNTLKSVEVSTQDNSSNLTEQQFVRNMNETNTYDATIDSVGKKIKVETAFSHKSGGDIDAFVTNVTTNGGVAYFYGGVANDYISPLYIPSEENDSVLTVAYDAYGTTVKGLVVFPEVIAKANLSTLPSSGTSGAAFIDKGTRYEFDFTNKDASTEGLLKSLKVGETTLQVGAGSDTISGTIPYGMTIDSSELSGVAANKAHYLDFTISDYAALKTEPDSTEYSFISGGDKDLDGEADATPADDNAKLVFVRGLNNTVTVHVFGAAVDSTNPVTSMDVYAEEDLTTTPVNSYSFELKYADANTGANITSFKLGNAAGTINGTTINVTVPYGTELKALVPTFTLSTGATASVAGSELVSGKTVLNCTNDIKITVKSENEKTSKVYTLKTTVADQFSDVDENDWFYQNVMDAAANGYVSGEGDGVFNPYGATTRAAFAAMIANAKGFVATGDETSPFVDVSDDHWAAAAIAFCYENGYLGGYNDGTFRPNQAITRQEAAAILNNTFDLSDYTTEDKFVDDASIATWARAHVYAAKASGVMSGDVAGTFRPNDTITRAEAASIMMNANRLGFID